MVAIVTDVHYRMSAAVVRELGENGIDVICCESDRFMDDPASPPLGALSHFSKRFVWLPEESLLQALAELCCLIMDEYGEKPALLPVGAGTLAKIASERDRFNNICGLLIPSEEQLDLFNDKVRLAALASILRVPVPTSFARDRDESVDDFVRRISYPCVVKPVCGEKLGLSAAQRYAFADEEGEAKRVFLRFRELSGVDPIVQQRLPGGGFGCSVLAKDGKIVRSICHRRIREYPVTGGPSSCCCCVDRPDLRSFAEQLVAHTGYNGLAMFEFKEDAAGTPYLLEVNPRVWGTYPLTRVSESGMSLAWYALACGERVSDNVPPRQRKMIFMASDMMAAVGYLRRGKFQKSIGVFLDFFDPSVCDGLFEWKDPKPAIAYFKSLFIKRRQR